MFVQLWRCNMNVNFGWRIIATRVSVAANKSLLRSFIGANNVDSPSQKSCHLYSTLSPAFSSPSLTFPKFPSYTASAAAADVAFAEIPLTESTRPNPDPGDYTCKSTQKVPKLTFMPLQGEIEAFIWKVNKPTPS